jgi:hypothetical protein
MPPDNGPASHRGGVPIDPGLGLVVTGWVQIGADKGTWEGCAIIDCVAKTGAYAQRFSNLANKPPENQH